VSGVTAAAGFEAGGLASGIKVSGAADLALVATDDRRPVPAAGVFTRNLVAAAPVLVSRDHLEDGRATAVVLNSGNANAATGEAGRRDARRMCELTGSALGCASEDVLVCQTGLIGIPMPMAPVETGIPKLAGSLGADVASSRAAADAILTTDTVRKETLRSLAVDGASAVVGGMAKGAAMLSPAMATMLAVLTTDAAVEHEALRVALAEAVDRSFNVLSVDGCLSTNDTVLVLASGRVGNAPIVAGTPAAAELASVLGDACFDLARQMAADAEGATKLVRLEVRGAGSAHDARLAARGVANSQLVQCSLYGNDPYWGRVLSELGASGAQFDPELVSIAYQGVEVCRHGIAALHDADALTASMAQRDIEIVCDLHAGEADTEILFTDLTHAYVDENMGTS
jgi:glutamate N-acetyltransferase / amino-acid N-acetyltransferase